MRKRVTCRTGIGIDAEPMMGTYSPDPKQQYEAQKKHEQSRYSVGTMQYNFPCVT